MIAFMLPAMAAIPPLPSRPPAVDGECARAIPLVVGELPPEDVIEPAEFTVSCAAVVVPSSQVAHLLAIREWAVASEELYRLEIASLEAQRGHLEQEGRYLWWQGAVAGIAAALTVGVLLTY